MAIISFTTAFDISGVIKSFKFEDTADYAGQGIALADVNGVFKITTPSGTVMYNNTNYSNGGCDIRNFIARDNQTVILLPLATNGFPELGTYTIEYTVYDTNLSEYSSVTNTYTYEYVRPEICIEQTVDVISPLFTSTDATDYVVDGITPSLVRTHTIYFPVGSGLTPVTGAGAVVSVGFAAFANGTQTTEIVAEVEYLFTDGLTIIDEFSAVKEVVVDATYICGIYCGVRSIEQQLVNARLAGNTSETTRLTSLFTLIMGLVGLIDQAIKCGKSADVSGYLTFIMQLGNFSDDCCCDGDEPTLVTGLGGLINNVVVDSCGTPVTVTPVTVGNTTTYTVCLDPAFVTLVNSHYNTIVSAGTNVSVVDSGIISGVRTFTVNADATNPVLYNTQTPVSTTNAAMTILQSYTLAADQLSADGDVIEITADFDTDGVNQAKAIDLRIGGTVCHSKVTEFRQTMGQKSSRLIVRATRQSATTLFITFLQSNANTNYQTLGDGRLFYETGFSVSNLTSNTTLLEVRGRNIDGVPTETINCAQLLVMYYKK